MEEGVDLVVSIKILGAIMIALSCFGFGLSLCVSYQKELRQMRMLTLFLEHIRYELEGRLTPLPQLISHASRECTGYFKQVLEIFVTELDEQILPDTVSCMQNAFSKCKRLSPTVITIMLQLASALQRFDLSGQLVGIERLRNQCVRQFEAMEVMKTERLRSYRTFAFCAGAAIVILLF